MIVVVEHAARVSFLVSHRSFNHCLTRLDSEVPHSREFPAKGRRRMDEDSRNFKPPHPCIATRRSENEDRDRRVSNGRDQVAQSPVRAIAVIDAPIRPVCREKAIERARLWLAHFPMQAVGGPYVFQQAVRPSLPETRVTSFSSSRPHRTHPNSPLLEILGFTIEQQKVAFELKCFE